MSKHYVLAKSAAADLSEIVRYTRAQWGEAQCVTYIAELENATEALARGEGPFKDLSALHPQLRMVRSGRHYIFCLPRPNALPVILAILHERMNMMARLKDRLT